MIYRCWDPYNGAEEHAVEIECYEPSTAAQTFARRRWHEEPFEVMEVMVDRALYTVHVELVPEFTASRVGK